jgi:hypothetical protein
MSVFETEWEVRIFLYLFRDKSEWRVPMFIVISNKVHRQLHWHSDTMNFSFDVHMTMHP